MFRLSRSLFGSDESRDWLRENNLSEIDAVYTRMPADNGARHDRTVFPITLSTDDARTTRVFVKLNWGFRRLIPRSTDLRTGQALLSLPAREWEGLERLSNLGLHVPERLAYFEEGTLRFRAAVLVKEVPARQSIEEMILDGAWGQLSADDRNEILDMMLAAMRTMHAARIAWRGASCRHFFPARLPDGGWTVWLIDCEGVHTTATSRDAERDLRKLWKSFVVTGADRKTLERLSHEKLQSSNWPEAA